MKHKPIWLTDAQVAEVLTPQMAFEAVTGALTAHARGLCVQPLKPYVRPGGREREYEMGRHIAMPCYVGNPVNAVGIKWISSVPRNIEIGLPRASGVVVLNDLETGRPTVVMECGTLSARRTAAVTAVTWHYFGPKDGRVSLIGCGPVNREVAVALSSRERRPAGIRVYDLNQGRMAEFCKNLTGELGVPVSPAPDLEHCVRGASAVIAAVTGSKNYIDSAWLDACRLMLPLSLDDFGPDAILEAEKIVVDEFEGCVREEKTFHRLVLDGLIDRNRIYAELGEVVVGKKPGRTGDERVFGNLMGMAVEDISVAKKVYDAITTKE